MRQFYNGNIELVNVIKKGGKKRERKKKKGGFSSYSY